MVLKYHQWSIRSKFAFLIVFICVIPILVLGLRTDRLVSDHFSKNLYLLLKLETKLAAAELDNNLSAGISLSATVAQDKWLLDSFGKLKSSFYDPAPGIAALQERVTYFKRSIKGLEAILVVDSNGKVILSSSPQWTGKSLPDHEILTKVRQGEHAISSPLWPDDEPKPFILIAYPILNEAKQFVGAVVTEIYTEGLREILVKRANSNPKIVCVLVDQNLIRIAHSTAPELELRPLIKLPADQQVILLKRSPFGRRTETLLIEGATELTTWAQGVREALSNPQGEALFRAYLLANQEWNQALGVRLKNVPWVCTVFIPESEIRALMFELRFGRGIGILLFAALASMIGVALSRTITKPIHQLTEASEKVAQGDFQVRVPVTSADEIGKLAQVFNMLIQRVSDTIEALRKSQDKYQHLVDQIPGAVFELTFPDLAITYICPYSKQIHGFTQDEQLSNPNFLLEHIHPSDIAGFKESINQAVATKNPQIVEFRLRTKDERWVWIRAYIRIAFDDQGKPLDIHGVAFDITALKEAQEAQFRLEKLKMLGEIAAGVAHDINNILTAIIGYAELLSAKTEDEKAKHYAKLISKSAEDIANIVGRMQSFYKAQRQQEWTLIDINNLLVKALENSEFKWKQRVEVSGIKIDTKCEFNKVDFIKGNSSELHEVFLNIILNAVDAMPQGGSILVKTWQEGASVYISITDTGTGMDEETKRRVFEPFFTTKEEGTGLGMSLAYQIINRHGGTIEVESEIGVGTTFIIKLPIAVSQEVKEEANETRAHQKFRILIVDDDLTVLEVLKEVLKDMGHEVETAPNGGRALHIFKQQNFDLVITDLGMPIMNGLEVSTRIKGLSPKTPIILLTGWGDQVDEEEAARAGVKKVLSKPVLRETLERAILELMSV
jgi:PAS domain S-box-containing protein